MSDKDDKDGKKTEPKEKTLVEPVPQDAKFFGWLDGLFNGSPAQYPDRLQLRVVIIKGKLRQYGMEIANYPFAPQTASPEALKKMPGRSKPSKEELVKLSNEMLCRMQDDCNAANQRTTYGVFAWNFLSSDSPYDGVLMTRMPASTRSSPSHGEAESSDDDEDASMEKRFSTQILRHQEKMFDLYAEATAGLMDRYAHDKDRDHSEIESLRQKLQEKDDQLQRALSLESERDTARKWSELKVTKVGQFADVAMNLMPPIVAQLTGNKGGGGGGLAPTIETNELKRYFLSKEEGGRLTEEQSQRIFGLYEGGIPKVKGVLSVEQSQILYQVAHCTISADELDKILPDGPLGVSIAQLTELQKILTMDQIAPLMMLIHARVQRQENPPKDE